MGTWDTGVLDNDTTLDGLGDLAYGVRAELLELGAVPSPETLPKLAAAFGVLIQLSTFDFSSDSDHREELLETLRRHAPKFEGVSPEAAEVLRSLLEGGGDGLEDQYGELAPELCEVLHTGSRRSHFGPRFAPLLDSPAGRAYEQEIANRCIAAAEDDFEDEDIWWDLCRESSAMGPLCALLILQAGAMRTDLISSWREQARAGFQRLRDDEDEELEFQEPYYANVDRLFAALLG